MERTTSPIALGVTVVAVLGLVLGAYVGAYWWRLPVATTTDANFKWHRGAIRLDFPNPAETVAFRPAIWIHQRAHWPSFYERAGSAVFTSLGCFP